MFNSRKREPRAKRISSWML